MGMKTTALIAATLLALAGCTTVRVGGDVPEVARFNHGLQPSQVYLQASDHWRTVAADVAADVAQRVGHRCGCVAVMHDGGSVFDVEFADMLEGALLNAGVGVARGPASGEVVLHISAVATPFDNARVALRPANELDRPTWHEGRQWWASPAREGVPRYELVLNVRGVRGGEVVVAYSNSFYVPSDDLGLYRHGTGRSFPVAR